MDESEPSTPDGGSSLSSQGPVHPQYYNQSYSNAYNNYMVCPRLFALLLL